MKIGYARCSTKEQDVALQVDALNAAGCDQIYEEYVSGVKSKRPIFEECLRCLREGDTLIVWRLDRLGRKLKELLQIVEDLEGRGIELVSITDAIDTKTAAGRLIFQIFGAFAEFERNTLIERTMAGLKAARERGQVGGRDWRHKAKKIAKFKIALDNGTFEIADVLGALGFGISSWYRNVQRPDVQEILAADHARNDRRANTET